jgi:catechol 2,3-dioxygenase-like lactoylglutathione lyase family enzyme
LLRWKEGRTQQQACFHATATGDAVFTYFCLGTNNLQRAARFYDAALAPLGIHRCDSASEAGSGDMLGWGTYEEGGKKELALWLCQPFNGQAATAGNGSMVALAASSWAQVDAFYTLALLHGGSAEGMPGIRPQYKPDFYAAYVRDPDGNKLAAVCRGFTDREQSHAAR